MNKAGMDSDSQLDLSILRKPISTSITGFQEVMKAFENGTDEVYLHFVYTFFLFCILNFYFFILFLKIG